MDQREYLDILDREGMLITINQEVDWHLEAAAISAMMQRVGQGQYTLLFNNIKGYYPDRGRIASCLYAPHRRRPFEKIALLLGMPKSVSIQDFRHEFRRRMHDLIKPTEITSAEAPCKEVIKVGPEASMVDIPIPFVHGTDGGRYLTLHGIVNQDPDTGWTNIGIYRFMVKGPRRGASSFLMGPHGPTIFYSKWEPRGQSMPFCVVIGGEQLGPVVYASALAAGVCEYDVMGGLRQSPLEVVRAETNNLLVPAAAEVIIEGEVRPWERTDEGPFGEFRGFTHGRQVSPVFRVNCITHRHNPIIPMTVEGALWSDTSGVMFQSRNFTLLDYFHSVGLPAKDLYEDVDTNGGWHPISIDPPDPQTIYQIHQALFGHKAFTNSTWTITTDPDIDLPDTRDVWEEVGLNCDPRSQLILSDLDAMSAPLLFYTDPENKYQGTDGAKGGYDCTTKFKDPRFIPRKDTFEKAYPDEVRGLVERMWSKLGFDEPMEVKTTEV